jgi:glycosyltransferase involved in cell wall biosynthesis
MFENVPHTFEQVILKYPEETKGLISIIIPIYNTEQYLRQTLDSVIAQTFENWEAILVDDDSTDRCSEICIEYTEKDPRFKYIHKKNEGVLLARKIALENSRGEFIANLDSDDAYAPQFLEKMFAKIKEENCDFVWCNFKNLNGKKIEYSGMDYEFSDNKFENCYNIIDKIMNNVWNKLVKRSVYIKVLFPQIYGGFRGEDKIQSIQITYHSNMAKFVPEELYLYRFDSETSIANTTSKSLRDKRHIRRVVGMIVVYQFIKSFFGADKAEKYIVDNNAYERQSFTCYFLLSKKTIKKHKIEYIENFVPAFLRGLKKSKNVNFFRKMVSIWACKGFSLPFILCRKAKNIWLAIKAVFFYLTSNA